MGSLFRIALLAIALTEGAHAARHHPMTLQALVAGCSVDARSNPLVLSCPGGCMVTIANGMAGGPPQVQIGAACRALK